MIKSTNVSDGEVPTFSQLKLFILVNPLTERFGNEFFRDLPSRAGVYFFYDVTGKLLYVGQSNNLRNRISSYRNVSSEKHPQRILRLVARIWRIEWTECENAEAAIAKESELLLEHRPPFNRAGVWKGDPWWLKVEILEGRVHLNLTRENGGIGPLPSAFRYVFGSLIRCVYRSAHPSLPISEYPHGLFDSVVPLSIIFALPDFDEAARIITAYANGNPGELMTRLESLSLGASEMEQEYWQEEIESLRKYVVKKAQVVHERSNPPSPSIDPSALPLLLPVHREGLVAPLASMS
jgi:hypothetical protein